MTTRYVVGEMFFPEMKTDERYEGRSGQVAIGGDRADVHAASSFNDHQLGEDGVMLVDVELRTRLDWSGLTADELQDEAREIIASCYASIQEETFCPQKGKP